MLFFEKNLSKLVIFLNSLLLLFFEKIHYFLEEFNINYSFFKIYYYGNPKRLRTELLKFGYQLNNDQGHWGLYIND